MFERVSSLFGWGKKKRKTTPSNFYIDGREHIEIDARWFENVIRPVLLEEAGENDTLYIRMLEQTQCRWATRFRVVSGDGDVWFADQALPVHAPADLQCAWDYFSIGLANETIRIDESGYITIPHIVAVRWNAQVLSALGWEHTSGLTAYTKKQGIYLDEGFSIALQYDFNNETLYGVKTKGMVLQTMGQKRFTLPLPLFVASDALQRYRHYVKNGGDRKYAWARLLHVLKDCPVSEMTTGHTTLISANRFTVSLDSQGRLRPIMLKANRFYGDDDVQEALLTPEQNTSLVKNLTSAKGVSDQFFPVGRGSYLVVSDELATIMNVLRSAMQDSRREQLECFRDPVLYVRNRLKQQKLPDLDHTLDLVDSMFVETQEYLSARVRAFGIWEPKTLSFAKEPTVNWYGEITPDRLVIDEKSGVIFLRKGQENIGLRLEDVKKLLKALEVAQAEGERTIEFFDVRIPVTSKIMHFIRKYLAVCQTKNEEEKSKTRGRNTRSSDRQKKKEKRLRYGPKLKTNLRQLEYTAQEHAHQRGHPMLVPWMGIGCPLWQKMYNCIHIKLSLFSGFLPYGKKAIRGVCWPMTWG